MYAKKARTRAMVGKANSKRKKHVKRGKNKCIIQMHDVWWKHAQGIFQEEKWKQQTHNSNA